ncbi:hypothetical protein QBC46DRAFT_422639 [Diplogelasinospora grovesii]|uniref:CCHC-type domain-containing protein n=1 Tax=Diplogelasinospora grovesii TaxID=303347 RepID=A0AAN6N056_9PEZI|nr:hypothetical protein QBC46DRAFT_422639 [Diplogelasinospora grovesii]
MASSSKDMPQPPQPPRRRWRKRRKKPDSSQELAKTRQELNQTSDDLSHAMRDNDDLQEEVARLRESLKDCRDRKDKADDSDCQAELARNSLAKEYRDPTVTFEGYARLGADIAMTMRQTYREKEKERKANATTGGGSGGSRTTGYTGGNAGSRVVNTQSSSKGKLPPRPTVEEARKLAQEGRCFTCREKGHVARDCPEKEKAAEERDARLQAICDRFKDPEDSQDQDGDADKKPSTN